MDTLKQKYLVASKGGSWHRTLPLAVAAATWLFSASSAGAVAVNIQSIQLSPSGNPNPTTTTTGVTYQGQSQSIISFTDANRTNWQLTGGSAPTLILRRSNTIANPTEGDYRNQQVVFGRQGTSSSTVLPPVPTSTESVLNNNNIFSGTDNLFANTYTSGSLNRGNISDVERADFIFNPNQTVNSANALGVTVFERGSLQQGSTSNFSHDSFRIAAITGIDNSNPNDPTPTAYGSLVSLNRNTWGTNGLTDTNNYTVVNRSGNTGDFTISDDTGVTGQSIGGVVIPLTDLVSTGTRIYGYSLFAADVSSSANLVDFLSFPTNTSTADTAGGIDLLSANLGVAQVPFNFSPSLGLLILGATWGTTSLWRRNRTKPVKLS